MLTKLIFSCVVLVFLSKTTNSLDCYDCNDCADLNSCQCTKITNVKNGEFYCSLTREFIDTDDNRFIKPVPRNVTDFYVYEPYYISVDETISYNRTAQKWTNRLSSITFGCQEDRCNRADLLKSLSPTGFSFTLPTNWLNDSLFRPSTINSSYCHECPDEVLCSDDPDFIDLGKCHDIDCSTRCALTESFREAESPTYCFQSLCEDEPNPNAFVGVTIRAVYYLRRSSFELVGIDIFCQAEVCDDLQMFKAVRDKLEKDLSWTEAFVTQNNAEKLSFSSFYLFFIVFILFEFILNHR